MTKTKNGYKLTKLGEIPIDWVVNNLGEVCAKIQDGNYGAKYPKSSELLETGVPFLTSKVLGKEGNLNYKLIDYISEEKHAELKKAHLKLNDVLFTNRGASVGAIGLVNEKICNGNIGPQLTLLRNNPTKIISDFLYQAMKSYIVQKQILNSDSGSAMKFFGIEETKKFLLVIPPIPEQKKIVSILSTWDKAIELKEKLIELMKEQKKGLMQKLLIGHIRWNDGQENTKDTLQKRIKMISNGEIPKGYKSNKFGIFPEDWKIKVFEDLFDFEGGYSITREQLVESGTCYLHYGDIHKYERSYIDIEEDYDTVPKIEQDAFSINQRHFLNDGDIVFADASEDYEGIGKSVVIINRKGIPFVSGLHTIIAKSKTDMVTNGYKKFFMSNHSIRKQIAFYATGTSVLGISKNNLKKIVVILPDIEEQQKIAEILSTSEKEIKTMKKQLDYLKEQKKGLMQLLLTGKVRVKE